MDITNQIISENNFNYHSTTFNRLSHHLAEIDDRINLVSDAGMLGDLRGLLWKKRLVEHKIEEVKAFLKLL